MSLIPLPSGITDQIAHTAVRYAQSYALDRNWSAGYSINPTSAPGIAGLKVAKKYLMYQEQGTKPYLMTSLEGKTVPIKDADGLHFIKVRGVGQPGWVTLPGGVRKWRQQKWRHPGIKPTHFMRDSINRAYKDSQPAIFDMLRTALGGGGE